MAKSGRIKKRPYCSPKITRVNLRSEEAALTACKVDDSTVGPNDPNECRYHGSNCSVLAS